MSFLYTDESGARCPGCGSVLLVGDAGDRRGKVRGPCRLMLSEQLEGSGLHGKLTELAGEGGGLRVLVDRTGETRTVRLVLPVSGRHPSAEDETR